MIRPIKRIIKEYTNIENEIMKALATQFKLNYPLDPIVKTVDTRCLLTEERFLLKPSPEPWGYGLEPANIIPQCLPPKEAETAFLKRFAELIKE
jgi:hypothetical protein